jgi:hypothetical protein
MTVPYVLRLKAGMVHELGAAVRRHSRRIGDARDASGSYPMAALLVHCSEPPLSASGCNSMESCALGTDVATRHGPCRTSKTTMSSTTIAAQIRIQILRSSLVTGSYSAG